MTQRHDHRQRAPAVSYRQASQNNCSVSVRSPRRPGGIGAISAGRRAVIKGTFAMSAARRAPGQLDMQPPGLHIYAPQSCTKNARSCRSERRSDDRAGVGGTSIPPTRLQSPLRKLGHVRRPGLASRSADHSRPMGDLADPDLHARRVDNAIASELDRSGRPMSYGAPTYPSTGLNAAADPIWAAGRAVEVLIRASVPVRRCVRSIVRWRR